MPLISFIASHTLHFALESFVAFSFFATGWLYMDAWRVKPTHKSPLYRAFGFFLLALGTLLHATDSSATIVQVATNVLPVVGLGMIWASLLSEPLLAPPASAKMRAVVPWGLSGLGVVVHPLIAGLFLLVGITYRHKATTGYDKQLAPAARAFFLFALAHVGTIALSIPTTNVFWQSILAEFGPLWYLVHDAELAGAVILALWTLGYLRFRLEAQLFILSVFATLAIFLTTTMFFTFLLFRSLERDTLAHLTTDVNVLTYSLERLQAEARAHAQSIAADPAVAAAIRGDNATTLHRAAQSHMLARNLSVVTITSPTGEVLARGEDKDRIGDTLATHPVVAQAREKHALATITTRQDSVTPTVEVLAGAPVGTGTPQGTILAGFTIDSAFVDGLKAVTGLDATIYAADMRAATTITSLDGKTRFIGTKEADATVRTKVLEAQEPYTGSVRIAEQLYFGAYRPLKTYNDTTIGMVFVGKPQSALAETAQRSITLTFIGSAALMLLSLVPAYVIAKYLTAQVQA